MNTELARKALAAIRKYPDAHNQVWFVSDGGRSFPVAAGNGDRPPWGTTLCMAGWAAFLAAPDGAKIDPAWRAIVLPDGKSRTIEHYARDLLGLTDGQVEALFFGANSADHLTAMVDLMAVDPDATEHDLMLAAGLLNDPWVAS